MKETLTFKENRMPIKKCKSGGKSGKKYGDTGKCYTGPGAESKAKRQGRAVKASQGRRKGK
jgi:hypothetical protein